MFHVKKMTAAALAALMIAGAVPALADSYAPEDAESVPAQEETVTESAKKPHKKRAKSSETDETADAGTGATASARRKPAKKSADSEESSETTADASAKPARKHAKKSSDAQAADSAASGDGAATDIPAAERKVKPSAKPSRRPARKPEKKDSASSDTDASTDTAAGTV